MSGYHDIGGKQAGSIEKVELPFQHWEKQTEAVRNLLGDATRRILSLDELRNGFESFGLEKYQRYSFYRRRLEAMIDTLEKKGFLTREEFEVELAEVQKNWSVPCEAATK